MIRCPMTDGDVPTGMVVDEAPGAARHLLPRTGTLATCGDCGRKHTWWRADAWLEGQTPRKTRPEMA